MDDHSGDLCRTPSAVNTNEAKRSGLSRYRSLMKAPDTKALHRVDSSSNRAVGGAAGELWRLLLLFLLTLFLLLVEFGSGSRHVTSRHRMTTMTVGRWRPETKIVTSTTSDEEQSNQKKV